MSVRAALSIAIASAACHAPPAAEPPERARPPLVDDRAHAIAVSARSRATECGPTGQPCLCPASFTLTTPAVDFVRCAYIDFENGYVVERSVLLVAERGALRVALAFDSSVDQDLLPGDDLVRLTIGVKGGHEIEIVDESPSSRPANPAAIDSPSKGRGWTCEQVLSRFDGEIRQMPPRDAASRRADRATNARACAARGRYVFEAGRLRRAAR